MMKKLLISILAVLLAVFMLANVVGAQDEKKLSVLCIGNSILQHPVAAHLGWYWDWGMAASAEDKDYYSVLQQLIKEEFPEYELNFARIGGNYIERSVDISTDKDYTQDFETCFGKEMRANNPDIIILQIGDNISSGTQESYAHTLVEFVEYCRAYNPNVTVILSEHFYGNPTSKFCNSVLDAAKQTATPSVKLYKYNGPEYLAGSAFEHSGVAGHPGDKGMQAIAEEYFSEIRKVLLAKEGKAEVSVKVDGEYVDFEDVTPTIIDGFTLVPLRAIFEALGATVDWDDATKTVTSVKNDVTISLTIGSPVMKKNDEEIKLDVVAQIIDERTLVPVRAISEAYDCTVSWIDKTKCVDIYSPKEVIVGTLDEIEGALITLADAENKTGGYPIRPGSAEILYVPNPEDENDTVFYFKTIAEAGRRNWTYFWCEATGKLVPGKRYLASFDIMLAETAAGTVPSKTSGGINFSYSDTAGTSGDHATTLDGKSSNFILSSEAWTHIDYIYTMSETMDPSKSASFGIYANPEGDNAISFYIDNISVVPYEGDFGDGFVDDIKFTQKIENFDFATTKGVKVDLEKLTVENAKGVYSDGIFTATSSEEQTDPQIIYSDCNIDASKYKIVAVKFKKENVTRVSNFQLFFTTDTDNNFDEKKSISMADSNFIATDDGYVVAFFNMGKSHDWKGNIDSIRMDPANSPGVYTFTDIVFVED